MIVFVIYFLNRWILKRITASSSFSKYMNFKKRFFLIIREEPEKAYNYWHNPTLVFSQICSETSHTQAFLNIPQ